MMLRSLFQLGNPEPRYKWNVIADSIDGVTWDQESECLHLNFFGQFFLQLTFKICHIAIGSKS